MRALRGSLFTKGIDMNILEIIGGIVLIVLVGLAIGHAFGKVKFSAEIVKDE